MCGVLDLKSYKCFWTNHCSIIPFWTFRPFEQLPLVTPSMKPKKAGPLTTIQMFVEVHISSLGNSLGFTVVVGKKLQHYTNMQRNQETGKPEILNSFHLLEQWFSKIRTLERFGTSWTWAWFQSFTQIEPPCNFAIQNSKHLQISKYATQQPIQHPKCNPPTWNITTFPTQPRKPPKNRASRGTHWFFVTIFTFPGSKYGDQTSVKETHRLCVHGLHYPAVFWLWWSVAYFMMSQEIRQTMGTP